MEKKEKSEKSKGCWWALWVMEVGRAIILVFLGSKLGKEALPLEVQLRDLNRPVLRVQPSAAWH